MSNKEIVFTRRNVFQAITLIAFVLIPWLGLHDFSTRGEAREALVGRSILTTGNWILPRSYNGSVPSKPPFLHWLMAISSMPFGQVNEFSARLPSAVLALLTVGFFLFLLKDFFNTKAQIFFILLLSFSFEWLRASVSTRVDMVHAGAAFSGITCCTFRS